MTAMSTNPAPSLGRIQHDAPILFIGGLMCTLLIIPYALAIPLDPRTLEGVSIWAKPLKFAVALAIYLLTLAYFARFAPSTHNDNPWTQRFHAVVLICVAGEIAWIGGAAMWGTTSHFNIATPFMAAIYSLMGVFAVALTAASLVMGIAIVRSTSGLPFAIGWSLIATFGTTVIVAGTMSAGMSHFVGGTSESLMPMMGWARDIGDLRVPHFFATHIMHIAPLMALAAWTLGLRSRAAMIAPTVIVTAFTLATFIQALNGQPFLPFLG